MFWQPSIKDKSAALDCCTFSAWRIIHKLLNTINKKAVKNYVFSPKLRHCLKIVNLKSSAVEYN